MHWNRGGGEWYMEEKEADAGSINKHITSVGSWGSVMFKAFEKLHRKCLRYPTWGTRKLGSVCTNALSSSVENYYWEGIGHCVGGTSSLPWSWGEQAQDVHRQESQVVAVRAFQQVQEQRGSRGNDSTCWPQDWIRGFPLCVFYTFLLCVLLCLFYIHMYNIFLI